MKTRKLTGRHLLSALVLALAIHVALVSSARAADEEAAEETPVTVSWDGHLVVASLDETFLLKILGRIQPRYEFEARGDEWTPVHSSMYLRRARLDFRGHVFTPDLTYRLMPDWSRTATLRDGWLNYRFADWLETRAGQFQIPFAWERDSSSNRHQFMERSAANNEFEWPTGRDIGVAAHGTVAERFRYAIGGFSGQGRNAAGSTSPGHLVSGRMTYTLAGEYPNSEAPVEPVDGVDVAVGIGGYYAFRNTVRDWAQRTDETGPQARVGAGTADGQLQWGRLSTTQAVFAQRVRPAEPADGYRGVGYTGHFGVLMVENRLFAAIRYSDAIVRLDPEQRRREITAGAQIFQRDHAAKLLIDAGIRFDEEGRRRTRGAVVRAQYQLLF